jgi:FeS assembly SUF system protein
MPKPVETIHHESPEVAPTMSTIERSMFEHAVVEEIRTVYDPELPVNVYDLGLIYDIQVSDNKDVHILMTLTSPACPVAGSLPGEVQAAARATPGIGRVSVELTWDPPYTLDSMPEETRIMLGF